MKADCIPPVSTGRAAAWRAGTALVRAMALAVVLAGLAASVWVWRVSYPDFTGRLFAGYGPPEKLARFREVLLTPARFEGLRQVLPCLAALLGLGVWRAWRHVPGGLGRAALFVRFVAGAVRAVWRGAPLAERLAVGGGLAGVLAVRLYFAGQTPLHIDERFTYLYFVSKGWWVSAAYYPNPNNHILFSLLCTVAARFTTDPWWVLRGPALLTGMAALGVFWLAARHFFPARPAGVAAGLLAFAPPVMGYAWQGRGYSLLVGCTVLAAAALVKMLPPGRPHWRHGCLFALACTAGFYSVPVFLYPFAGFGVYAAAVCLRSRDIRRLQVLATWFGAAAVGVGAVYLPVFLANGREAVSGNAWVAPLPWAVFQAQLLPNLAGCSRIFWHDVPAAPLMTVLLGVAAGAGTLSRRMPPAVRHWLGLYVCCLWVAVPLVLLQRTLLYGRVFVYVLPLQVLAVALLARWAWAARRGGLAVAGVAAALYAAVAVQAFRQHATPAGRGLYNSLDGVSEWLYRQRADGIYVQYYEYGLCIRFRYETTGRPVNLDVGADRFSNRKNYTFVVLHRSHAFPAQLPRHAYTAVYRDAEAVIYKRI